MKNTALNILLVMFGIVFLFQLNNSSIEIFCNLLPIGCSSQYNAIIGHPRIIRSDEWMVVTPFLLAQYQNGHKIYTNLIGNQSSIFLMTGLAVNSWQTFFYPFNLPQHVLPPAYGLTATLLLELILFAFLGYLFFLQLKVPYSLAFLLTTTLYISTFLEWWNAQLFLIWFFAIFLVIFSWIKCGSNSVFSRFLYIVLLIYLLISFALILYPPFQVPLGLLISYMTFCLLFDDIRISRYKYKKLFSFIPILIAGLFAVGFLLVYFQIYQTEFLTISETVYPGNRLSKGGDFPSYRLLSGFYDYRLQSFDKPIGNLNQSEFSGFFLVSLFLYPLIFWQQISLKRQNKPLQWLLISTVAFEVFILIWMLFGFPDWLASITLLNRVPANRAYIGLGLASFITTVLFIYYYPTKITRLWPKVTVSLMALLFIAQTGWYLHTQFPEYLPSVMSIAIISSIGSLLVFFAANKQKLAFAVLLFLLSFYSSFRIYPLRIGLGPITDSNFAKNIKQINSENPGRWVVYNNRFLSPLLYANGLRSLTGVYLYPQFDLWQTFDPTDQYIQIWNRYAHVYFVLPESIPNDTITFNLTAPDSFTITIDPCHPVLTQLEVAYVVSLEEMTQPCLEQIDTSAWNHGVRIYQRNTN